MGHGPAEIVRDLAAAADAVRADLREGGGRRLLSGARKCASSVPKRSKTSNYKDYRMLGQFVAESGKIVPRRLTGVCAPHQHRLSSAIKMARNIALLPFAGRAS